MKNICKRLFAVLVASALLLGCSSGGKEDKILIGVSFASEVHYRNKFDSDIMTAKAEELGAEIVFQYANYDGTKQANQIDNLLSQGIDVLVLNAVSANMVNLVERVKAEGIPVITYDQTIEGTEIDLNVDRDNKKVGRLQMEAALDFTEGVGGNFVLVKGDPGSGVAQRIGQGYEEFASEHPEINIVADQFHEAWSPDKALKTVENALSANNDDIQAIVASADSVALGLVPAIKASNLEGKVYLSGMDLEVAAARLINEGIMTMSIWTDIIDGDNRTIEAAVKLAKGEEVVPDEVLELGGYKIPTLLIDVVAITKDNLEYWVTDIAPEGWTTMEEIFGEDSGE